jgi:putative peptidoglycan lipid II flippase
VGLALAVATSSVVNFTLLLVLLRLRLGLLGLRQVVSSGAKAGVAAAACGGVAYLVARAGDWSAGGARPLNYAVLLVAVVAGLVVYLALARLLRAPELSELVAAFRRRRSEDQ